MKKPTDPRILTAVILLEEKLCREYNLTSEKLRSSTIEIKDRIVTIKGDKK
jgi:hypothetical protein